MEAGGRSLLRSWSVSLSLSAAEARSRMSNELDVIDRYDLINKVATIYHKGNTNPTAIAKELGLKRAEVLSLIEEWKDIARNDTDVRAQAAEVLQAVIQHYAMLIAEGWSTIEQADTASDLKTKATLIKAIADIEAKKVDMLQKAGLYDDAALGDELAEMEEKQQILIGILKDVTSNCDNCKFEVARRLSRVTGKTEPIHIDAIEGEVVPEA